MSEEALSKDTLKISNTTEYVITKDSLLTEIAYLEKSILASQAKKTEYERQVSLMDTYKYEEVE